MIDSEPKYNLSDEIDGKHIAAIRSYMLSMPDARTEVVDSLIEYFKKLNRGEKDTVALRDYLNGIPGTKLQAVDELIQTYDQIMKATNRPSPHTKPTGIFNPTMINGQNNVGDTVSGLEFSIALKVFSTLI